MIGADSSSTLHAQREDDEQVLTGTDIPSEPEANNDAMQLSAITDDLLSKRWSWVNEKFSLQRYESVHSKRPLDTEMVRLRAEEIERDFSGSERLREMARFGRELPIRKVHWDSINPIPNDQTPEDWFNALPEYVDSPASSVRSSLDLSGETNPLAGTDPVMKLVQGVLKTRYQAN